MASWRLRARLFHLPPSIRASVFQQSVSKRSFSATNARKADLATTIAGGPGVLLDTLHTFMPWYIAIPTAAVLVRGVLVYYAAALPNRKRAIIRRHLYPLWNFQARYAWSKYKQHELDKHRRGGRTLSHTAAWMLVRRIWINAVASHKTGSLYGAPVFSGRSLFNFGMMIAFTEALRIKCGSREGLLPILLHPIEWAKNTLADPVANGAVEAQTMTPDELLAQRLEMAREIQKIGELPKDLTDAELLQQSHHLSPLNAPEYAAYLDPTLQAEGLSWCSDLTAVDPTFGLPIALSLTIAASAFLRSAADQLKAAAPVKDRGPLADLTLKQRATLTISLIFFFMAIKLPAALLLYLVPSFAVGLLQSRWLDLRYPLPAIIQPSKRPMRVKVKKTFGDV
ncbi:hypothetical protein DOTSEDRAFT_130544 [Dothistroma septosporum NZE10]|uniref:Uncharacterized protein n=1 Tax=Dothistroma septosporum (strain NZE10 / CBS 128990) TaxID=675120 RepID=N1PMC7_DOTSN|nr:hypothetical protein DOTSEDRAFT_130544 [Dothistroma septosporum NZE10]